MPRSGRRPSDGAREYSARLLPQHSRRNSHACAAQVRMTRLARCGSVVRSSLGRLPSTGVFCRLTDPTRKHSTKAWSLGPHIRSGNAGFLERIEPARVTGTGCTPDVQANLLKIRTVPRFGHRAHSENNHRAAEKCPGFGPSKRAEFCVLGSLFGRGILASPGNRQPSLPKPENLRFA